MEKNAKVLKIGRDVHAEQHSKTPRESERGIRRQFENKTHATDFSYISRLLLVVRHYD